LALVYCTACGEQISEEAASCPKCGHPQRSQVQTSQVPKSRIVAGVLALVLGGLGVHKFYLGKVGLGVLYILFVWTFIPTIVALVEGLIYLLQDDKAFEEKQGVRVT
jgi:TM2 domain-containing membrane protein YozV